MPSIAAIVATHNRPELLASRSLASIARQTRPPDYLIVVDDSDPDTRRANADVVSSLDLPGAKTYYLENRRTAGASGAWNTALYHLQDVVLSAYAAILDDDDSWDPSYLARCERAVVEQRLDMVAAGILYHHSPDEEGVPLDPPDGLVVNDLLVGSTHVQGSNLFITLAKLLEVGGFDETLPSTTDRDLCIRLADLGTVAYGPLHERLVYHYADNDRPRLSPARQRRQVRRPNGLLPQVPHPHVRRATTGVPRKVPRGVQLRPGGRFQACFAGVVSPGGLTYELAGHLSIR